jgi:hypothetical protein
MIEDSLFIASKIFWLFARPNTFALFLACLGGAALIFRARWGRWPLLLGLGWFVAVLLTPLPAWITLPLEDRFPRPAEAGRVDGVIILGGAVEQLLTERRGIPALNGAAARMCLAMRQNVVDISCRSGTGACVTCPPAAMSSAKAEVAPPFSTVS